MTFVVRALLGESRTFVFFSFSGWAGVSKDVGFNPRFGSRASEARRFNAGKPSAEMLLQSLTQDPGFLAGVASDLVFQNFEKRVVVARRMTVTGMDMIASYRGLT